MLYRLGMQLPLGAHHFGSKGDTYAGQQRHKFRQLLFDLTPFVTVCGNNLI